MKILFIIPSYKPAYVYGGPIRCVSMLAEALDKAGMEISVFTTNANGKINLDVETGKRYDVEGVSVYYFKRWTGDHSNVSPGLLLGFLRHCKEFDVIHLHSWWNGITIPIALICRILGKRIIISPHGSITTFTFTRGKTLLKRLIHSMLGRSLLKKSNFHFTSQSEKDDIIQWVGPSVTGSILPNVLSLPDIIYGKPHQDGIFKLIFLSRIDPKKNVDFLLRVIKQTTAMPVSLVILGSGEKKYVAELKQYASDIPSVVWKGNVDGEEKFRMLAESDLFILPSHNENYGNVVIEALCQGTPVMISSTTGAKEYVQKNELGWVVDGDEAHWSKMLMEIWADHQSRADIRKRAPKCISPDFNQDEQVKNYITLYKNHLGSKGKYN